MTETTSLSPTVYVVDDDVSIRESLSSLIRAEGMQVEVFSSPLDFLALERLKDFACVVLDVRMPGLDGLSLQDELTRRGWRPPIIFITGHGDVPDAVRAMKAGAIDFLKKPFEDFTLLNAITTALSRVSSEFHKKLEIAELQARYDQLTPREREVLLWCAYGKTSWEIGQIIGCKEVTVNFHVGNILSKFAVTTRVMAVIKAIRYGMLQE